VTGRKYLPVADADLSGNERRYLLEAFDSGWISGSGPFVDRLDHALAEYCGVSHGISCANGTVALHLALLALGVGPGDEVIVPSLTYIATANAVTYCGATPVFADSDPDTWNLSAATIEPLITDRTRGIIAVHLYGNPVDMDPVAALARGRGLFVVEDAAEAHGVEYKGRRAGSLADIATLSFYGNKLMTTGEGGMVLTSDDALAAKVRLLRGQGMDPKRRYWFPIVGYNYRLTNLQCAVGLAQFERLPEFIETRRRLAGWYREAFKDLPGVTLQKEQAGGHSVWWMFSIRLASQDLRDKVMAALEKEGVETRPIFHPLHLLPPYEPLNASCANAERIGLGGVSLPSGGHVMPGDVARIRDVIRRLA